MDSPENEVATYESNAISEESRPSLVDASVQLDLVEECPSSDLELETVQNFPNGFMDLDMKLPITVQNCLPLGMQVSSELVVVANNETNFVNTQKIPLLPTDTSEPYGKRILIEQDGRTYIVAVPDGVDSLPGIVELIEKSPSTIESPQIFTTEENISLTTKQGINQNWFTSRAEKSTLHSKGHVWKQGMWSKEEVELLEANIRQYCEERDISTPSTIIFEMSKDERKDFYRTVAKGLNRPLFSVYRRVIRMYDNKNHVGKYTPEELEKLKQLRSIYGNDWQAIGTAMGRSASSIKDRCRLMKDNCNQGKWLPAEERRLAEAVYDLANALPGEMISSGLSWAVVAERVGTRSEKQCRTKWLNYLNWKEAGGTEWTREDDITLIYRVCTLNASDENHVDWNELAKGWLSVRSPQWLRGKWWSLKRHVPNANIIPFQDVCEFLYQQFILKIEGNTQDNTCSSPPTNVENTISLQSAQLLAQAKPTILHTLPAAPPGILIANVMNIPGANVVASGCQTPVVSLPSTEALELQNGGFQSVRVTPMIQTVEVLPNVQLPANPQTFLTAAHQAQPIPLTATVPTNHIIVHTVTAESLQESQSVPIQMVAPTQVIISTSNPLTSLASTQIPSAPSSPQELDHTSLEEGQVLVEDESYESEEIQSSDIHEVSELSEDEENESLCQNDPASHIILADPMLAASRSPDIMEPEKVAEDGSSNEN